MRVGGRFAPRRLLFGFAVSAAQSSGEYPGSKIAFFAVVDGFSVTCVGASELLLAARLPGGTRREAAADGGGRSALPPLGRGRYRPGLSDEVG